MRALSAAVSGQYVGQYEGHMRAVLIQYLGQYEKQCRAV